MKKMIIIKDDDDDDKQNYRICEMTKVEIIFKCLANYKCAGLF